MKQIVYGHQCGSVGSQSLTGNWWHWETTSTNANAFATGSVILAAWTKSFLSSASLISNVEALRSLISAMQSSATDMFPWLRAAADICFRYRIWCRTTMSSSLLESYITQHST